MNSYLLKKHASFADFIKAYADICGYTYDINELKRSTKVRGFYDKSVGICGGYAINKEAPFRVFSDIVEKEKIKNSCVDDDNSMEFGFFWVAPHLTRFQRSHVYLMFVWDALTMRRKYIVLSTKEKKLLKRFQLTYPNMIYQGQVHSGGYAYTLQGTSLDLVVSSFRILYFFWLRPLFVHKKHKERV